MHNNLKALKNGCTQRCCCYCCSCTHSQKNRSTISIYDVPIHSIVINTVYIYYFMNCLLKWQVFVFSPRKLFFCSRDNSRDMELLLLLKCRKLKTECEAEYDHIQCQWSGRCGNFTLIRCDTIRYGYVLFTFKYRYLSSKMNSSIFTVYIVQCTSTEAGRMIITFLFRILLLLPRHFFFALFCFVFNAKSWMRFLNVFASIMWCDVRCTFHQIHNNAY